MSNAFVMSQDDAVELWNSASGDYFEAQLVYFAAKAINFYADTLPGSAAPTQGADARLAELEAENAALRHDIERHIANHAADLSADARPVAICSICKGYGRYQEGNSGTESDGYAPNIVECECEQEERLPQYRTTLVARPASVSTIGEIEALMNGMSAKLEDETTEEQSHWFNNHLVAVRLMNGAGFKGLYDQWYFDENAVTYEKAVLLVLASYAAHAGIATRDAAPSDAVNARLAKFLDVAAGEGYVFDGIDAEELFLELFPDYFKNAAGAPRETGR